MYYPYCYWSLVEKKLVCIVLCHIDIDYVTSASDFGTTENDHEFT